MLLAKYNPKTDAQFMDVCITPAGSVYQAYQHPAKFFGEKWKVSTMGEWLWLSPGVTDGELFSAFEPGGISVVVRAGVVIYQKVV